MKIYKVKVNGKSYRVELESVEQVASEAVTEAKKEEKKAAPVVAGEGNKVESPIQGTVVNLKVKVGDAIKKGTPLIVVEAMKLENDVVSPCEGTVTELLVKKGDTVTAKQVIAVVK